jgi:two-component system nitrogen regulation response regulator GlnG
MIAKTRASRGWEPRLSSAPAGFAASGAAILVADRDPKIVGLISNALTRHGCAIRSAADGWGAWDALDDGKLDLVITDFSMPGPAGVDLVKKLRFAHPHLPVVLMAADLGEAMARYPELDGMALLEKPFEAESLMRSVEEAIWLARIETLVSARAHARVDAYNHWGLNE